MHKTRILFLDRDGVINTDHGYVGTTDRFEFRPGIFPFLRAAHDRGYRLAILTNQSGVARGLYTVADYEKVTGIMLAGLRREAIEIDLTLACFAHPDGAVAAHGRESFWRKPNPGMVLETTRRLNGDPARSAFLGDSLRDMQAAQAGGVGHCLWLTETEKVAPSGIILVRNFDETLNSLD